MYIGFSLVSLENCTKHSDDASTADQLLNSKKNTVKLLQQEFDAEIFNCNEEKLLNKPVVLDTTLLRVSQMGDDIFLNAKIKTNCVKQYFVHLKCTREVFEQYSKTKTNDVIVAANLTRMDNEKIIVNADSLEGDSPAISLGETVIFTGECLAIREVKW
jgi:hypothetical protein